MKRIIIALLITLPFTSNSQAIDVQKIHKNAVAFLLKNLNNPGSYKSVGWSKVEKIYTEFDPEPFDDEIREMESSSRDVKHRLTMANISRTSGNKGQLDTLGILTDSLITANNSIIEILKQRKEDARVKFKPTFSNYYVEHSYRARNGFNALILTRDIFILNRFYKVTDYGNVEERDRERERLQREIDELVNKY